MKISILATGTRGDVQPYIALGLGLQNAGYEVEIATTADFREFVERYGLECRTTDITVGEILDTQQGKKMLESGRNILQLIQENVFLSHMKMLLDVTWELCSDAEFLIYSAVGRFSAPHIAEKLGIPSVGAFPQPIMTPTRAFPNLMAPPLPLNGWYNKLTHSAFNHLSWMLSLGAVDEWREQNELKKIGLLDNPYRRMNRQGAPVLYAYSPTVLPKPNDWGKHVHVTGYWFLERRDDWQPSTELLDFLESGPPPVYVGYGSMTVNAPEELATISLKAIKRANVRGILLSNWDGISNADLPDEVFKVESCPHDWLFPQVAAVVHHGGAGTTAAGLRAGVPSVLVPFMGDQPFWADQVKKLHVGPEPIPRQELDSDRLAYAIRTAVKHEPTRQRAAEIGERIRAEDGVGKAIQAIEKIVETRSGAASRCSRPAGRPPRPASARRA
jgi:sterol 3beta-glucosyltransferase